MRVSADYERYLGVEALRRLEAFERRERTRQAREWLSALLAAFMKSLPVTVVHRALAGSYRARWEPSALLLADIKGFTPLTERMAKVGVEGAEQLADAVSSYFAPLVKIARETGGDLLHFSGDALSVRYLGARRADNALFAARLMTEFAEGFGGVKVSDKTYRLKLHMALDEGRTKLLLLGDETVGTKFALVGSVLRRLSRLEEVSAAGRITASRRFADAAHEGARWRATGRRGVLTLASGGAEARGTPLEYPAVPKNMAGVVRALDALSPFLPVPLVERLKARGGEVSVWGEHRRVTTLFVDYGGHDYERGGRGTRALAGFFKAMHGLVNHYGGTVDKVDFHGDGHRTLLLFGAPVAHEDDEERGAAVAGELVAAARERGFTVRMGLSSGSVFAGNVGTDERHEYTVMGDAVNTAARLSESAPKGAVLLSGDAADGLGERFVTAPHKALKLKGKRGAHAVRKLVRVEERGGLGEVRELTRLVGRTKELAAARRALKAVESGTGRALAFVADAGIGKSRLVREVVKGCAERGFTVLSGGCQSYGQNIAFLPWVEVVEGLIGVERRASARERRKRIAAWMKARGEAQWAPVVAEMLGVKFPENSLTRSLDAKLRRQRVLDLTLGFLRDAARRAPVAVVLEDLHWADSATIELLNYVGRNVADDRILLLLAYRPVSERWEITEKPHFEALEIKELSDEETVGLVSELLGAEVPDELKALLLERTQGNPFYAEELVRHLMEKGFVTVAKGRATVRDLSEADVPDTVQGVLVARMDLLDEGARRTLQSASVLGRDFEIEHLEALLPETRTLDLHLDALTRFDLVHFEEGRYYFKHVVTQEVAYDTLARGRRRALHIRIGEHMEREFASGREEHIGMLSHHFYRGRDWERAFYYSVEAGDRSKKAYANAEALGYYDRSLDVLNRISDAELDRILGRIKRNLKEAELLA